MTTAPMTLDDLQAYHAPLMDALMIDYHKYKIYSVPPPSSGGLTLSMTLKLLEPFDLKSYPLADAYALYINAMAVAWADRNVYMADGEFVNVPILGLLSPEYLNQRRALLIPNPSLPIGYVGPAEQVILYSFNQILWQAIICQLEI